MHPWFTAKLRQLCQAKEDAINRPNTRRGDQSGKEELFWEAKDPVLFQWHGFSVERSERQHQLQDTFPQHCGESPNGRQSEWVLLQVWKNTINTSSNPPLPPLLHLRSVKMMCVRTSERTREERHQAQTVCHQPVWNPVLTSWPPSSHRSSTDHWSCAKSVHASNALPSSPSQRNPKLLYLMTTDL